MKKRLLVSLLCTTGVLLAACGDDSGSSDTTTATTAGSDTTAAATDTTAAPATGEPIKIGVLKPIEAQFYSDPDGLAAVKGAIARVNDAGGVKGRPLELDFCNEGNDPNKATACARQFVTDKVVAVVASITITANDAVNEILSGAGIASVDTGALTPSDFSTMTNFPQDGSAAWLNAGVSAFAVQQGKKNVVLVRNDNPQTILTENLVKKAVEKAGGKLAGVVLLPPSAIADYAPLAQQILDKKPDVVDIPLAKSQAIGIVQAVRGLGSKVPFVLNSGAFAEEDLAAQAADLEDTLISSSSPWINDAADYPKIDDFKADMAKLAAAGDEWAKVEKMRPIVLRDWASVQLMAQVMTTMADAGTEINAANFLTAWKGAKDLESGVLAPWTPGNYQTAIPDYPNLSNTEMFVLKVSGGHMKLVQKDTVDVLQFVQ